MPPTNRPTAAERQEAIDAEIATLRQIENTLTGLSLTIDRKELTEALRLIAGTIAVEEAHQAYRKQYRERREQRPTLRPVGDDDHLFPYYPPTGVREAIPPSERTVNTEDEA